MKFLFVAQYGPITASSRTRVFDYLPFLEENGVVVKVVVVVPDSLVWLSGGRHKMDRWFYYLRSFWRSFWVGWKCVWWARQYDLLFIQKVLFPSFVARCLRFSRHKVIFDFDDAIFTTEVVGGDWITRLRNWRHRRGLPQMLRAACQAVVENPYNQSYAEQFCPKVSILTGPIDTERYFPVKREREGRLVLGWVGSRTTSRYLDLIRVPLSELGFRYSHIRLNLIGAGEFKVEGLQANEQEWSWETEVLNLQQFDIGLMPLPDDSWTKGKGGYKLLQYFAMGLPVVASPVGINCEIVEDGINGFLAEGDAEWVSCLDQLIRDPELRNRMGNAGRKKMEVYFSLKRSGQELFQILKSVAYGQNI